MSGERIHTRENKGDRGLLNIPEGGGGQDSTGETVMCQVVVRGHSYRALGQSEGVQGHMEFSLF